MHFDDGHGEGATPRCAHGYPVTEHRPGPLEGLLQAGGSLVFCKEFELGGVRRNKGMADAEPEEGA